MEKYSVAIFIPLIPGASLPHQCLGDLLMDFIIPNQGIILAGKDQMEKLLHPLIGM